MLHYTGAPLTTMARGPSINYRLSEPLKEAMEKRIAVTKETPTELVTLALQKLLKLC